MRYVAKQTTLNDTSRRDFMRDLRCRQLTLHQLDHPNYRHKLLSINPDTLRPQEVVCSGRRLTKSRKQVQEPRVQTLSRHEPDLPLSLRLGASATTSVPTRVQALQSRCARAKFLT